MIAITGLKDLEKFGKQAIHASEKIERDVNDVKKAVAGYVFLRMMSQTTVDTSKAISNWKIRTPNDQSLEREAYFPGKNRSTQPQSTQLGIRRELPNLESAKPGQSIFVSNNLDYVEDYLLHKDNLLSVAKKIGEYRTKQEAGSKLRYFK
jgi:hypothetical protein|tara:strand:+ start:314 stop:763 length:450 start_codon:yes stop_codon:yes gene_type:complete